ncbi:MAG: hypothetical protein M3070_02695 [Actinomycetota bacterium]|nr:hypothetical protein [Actinomycetota bacterium]
MLIRSLTLAHDPLLPPCAVLPWSVLLTPLSVEELVEDELPLVGVLFVLGVFVLGVLGVFVLGVLFVLEVAPAELVTPEISPTVSAPAAAAAIVAAIVAREWSRSAGRLVMT